MFNTLNCMCIYVHVCVLYSIYCIVDSLHIRISLVFNTLLTNCVNCDLTVDLKSRHRIKDNKDAFSNM